MAPVASAQVIRGKNALSSSTRIVTNTPQMEMVAQTIYRHYLPDYMGVSGAAISNTPCRRQMVASKQQWCRGHLRHGNSLRRQNIRASGLLTCPMLFGRGWVTAHRFEMVSRGHLHGSEASISRGATVSTVAVQAMPVAPGVLCAGGAKSSATQSVPRGGTGDESLVFLAP